ncbi:hypothetical protein [Rufibacter sp. LB8]|uniref:hypothetical protein n=1 Tax=Rufibacter sp. LB8 TaxID=2777781 RepID=UPI00178C393B|nr:hypothetical protein [Rufibacter sp. LB8]
MKKALLVCCIFLGITASGWAQTTATDQEPETLFQGQLTNGFYLAPSAQVSEWQGVSGFMLGGKGAWVLNKRFAVGLAGYGLTSKIHVGEVLIENQTRDAYLQVGYGGVLLEYTPQPARLVHFTFPVIIGIGGGAYTNQALGSRSANTVNYEVFITDTFFVVEPGAHAEINLAKYLRLGLGLSYRIAQGVNLPNSSDKAMSASAISMTFKFGKF